MHVPMGSATAHQQSSLICHSCTLLVCVFQGCPCVHFTGRGDEHYTFCCELHMADSNAALRHSIATTSLFTLLQGGAMLPAQPSGSLGPAPPDLATAARVLADQTQFIRTGDGVQLVCSWRYLQPSF